MGFFTIHVTKIEALQPDKALNIYSLSYCPVTNGMAGLRPPQGDVENPPCMYGMHTSMMGKKDASHGQRGSDMHV